MKAVPIHLFGDVDRVVDGALTVDDGVVAINGVAKNKGVMGVGSSTSRTSSASHYSGIKAFATYAHKAHYTEDKHRAQ